MSGLARQLIGESEVSAWIKMLDSISNPPEDSTLLRRLKTWDYVLTKSVTWTLAQRDAGTDIPDSKVPDFVNGDLLKSEDDLKNQARMAAEYLRRHV